MTIALLRSEIHRFLADPTPEVLCIRGRWGVGKTYAWLKFLGEAQTAGELKVNQYAYVSLFGLNTLAALRYAIFESTVTTDQYLDGPDIGTLGALLAKGMDWGRRARPFLDSIGGVLGRKDAGEALARASFLLVRNQLVCFDDLERAGDGLKQRDVLGLASFLKEQRKCKIVLLLNDEEMEDEQRKEFDRQLEKVVDINLRFDPTPEEAASIALDDAGALGAKLSPLTIKLGIVNIRVIKKIERMAKQLSDLLQPCGEQVVAQAMSTVVLGGWAVLQPTLALTIDFIRRYRDITFGMRAVQDGLNDEETKWHRLLQNYGYNNTEDLDTLILDGVTRGAFDEQAMLEAGRALQTALTAQSRENTFKKAWEQFHGDLTIEDDKLLDDLRQGALDNLANISPVNINGTVRLFRDVGRDAQADELIAKYVDAHADDKRIFDLAQNHFMADDVQDPAMVDAFAEKLATFVDARDPRALLLQLVENQGWDSEDVDLLATLSPGQFVELFESLRGSDFRRCVEFAQTIGRQQGASPARIGAAVEEALRLIAAKSPLRAMRLRRYGVELDDPEGEAGHPDAEGA